MGGLWFCQVFHQRLVLAGLLHCGCKSTSFFLLEVIKKLLFTLVLNHTLARQQDKTTATNQFMNSNVLNVTHTVCNLYTVDSGWS